MATLPLEFQQLAGAIDALGSDATAAFQRNVGADGSLPTALINLEVAAQLVMRAAQAAEPVYHTIAAALMQITNPTDQAPIIMKMRELTVAVMEGRPDQVAGIQAAVLDMTSRACANAEANAGRDDVQTQLRTLWARIDQLNEQIGDDIEYFRSRGYTMDEDLLRHRTAVEEEMEEIRRRNPTGYFNDPRYQQLQADMAQTDRTLLRQIEPQVQARNDPDDTRRFGDTQTRVIDRDARVAEQDRLLASRRAGGPEGAAYEAGNDGYETGADTGYETGEDTPPGASVTGGDTDVSHNELWETGTQRPQDAPQTTTGVRAPGG